MRGKRIAVCTAVLAALMLATGVGAWFLQRQATARRARFVAQRTAEYARLGIDAPPLADFVPLPPAVPHNAGAAALGARLFNDRRLVKSGKRTCGACHALNAGGTDGRIHGRFLTRSAYDTAFETCFLHDGRFTNVADVVEYMIAAPVCGGFALSNALPRLVADAALGRRFAAVYETGLVGSNVTDAVVQFLRTRTSGGGVYDLHLGGRSKAFPEQAADGFAVFRRARCLACHEGPALGGRRVSEGRKVTALRGLAKRRVFLCDGSAGDLPTALKRMPTAGLSAEECACLCEFLKTL